MLTERGGLALLWKIPTWSVEDTPWLDAIHRVVAQHKHAAGCYPAGDGVWQGRFESTGLFEPLVYSRTSHVQVLEPRGFLAQVASWSWIANLHEDQRETVLAEVEAVVDEYDELVIPYRTDLYLARRRTAHRRT